MKKSSLPDINIEQTPFDRQLEILALVGLAILLILPAVYYGKLPDSIPSHFNASGQPDAYSSKASIWLLPLVGVAIYIVVTLAGRHPRYINYPGKITEENQERVYTNMQRMIRVLKLVIMASFIWIVWATIKTGLGLATGLGPYFLPVFLLLNFGPIIFYSLKAAGKIN